MILLECLVAHVLEVDRKKGRPPKSMARRGWRWVCGRLPAGRPGAQHTAFDLAIVPAAAPPHGP
jgi:hypothetical protein